MNIWGRIALGIGAVVVVGAVGFSGYARLSPEDAARWDVDPTTAPDPATPNFARIPAGEVTGASIADLAAKADRAMLAMPRTTLFAGAPREGRMTYITRSLLMGYPDFTSIKVMAEGDRATLAAFARARFGSSDMGVNAARLDALRAALAP